MKILLTNDDGIDSPGLLSLKEVLESEHDVWVMAPDGDRSGQSQALTLKEGIRVDSLGGRMYKCAGSPVDCVLLSLLGAVEEHPDVVLSGINLGPNLGSDLVYSGTAGAARQAVFMDVPGVALSVNSFSDYDFYSASRFVLANLERFIRLSDRNHFLNINFPEGTGPWESRLGKPVRRHYGDSLVGFQAPRGGIWYFLQGGGVRSENRDQGDAMLVDQGYIAMTPVKIHPQEECFNAYAEQEFAAE